ncbi:MAG: tRNA (guanosine(46)-N7)-methyltransferase TrmB [Lachnospiraceae bacterium]|nr:tRNA (guanosine(46)-N7)-methyltransferase TrmB [Lachnospiraceae bacterium]
MRLRHIPGSEDIVSASPYVLGQPEQYRGRFRKHFGNNHPLEIEVGMGKGRFIIEMAQRHPQVNFLGIERYPSVLLRAIKKQEELQLANLFFLCVDAKALAEVFAPEEVSRIYLNFSDPWPKDRHAKRRLTSPEFMNVYDQILAKDGTVEFKTDNQGLFSYSLASIPEAGWQIHWSTRDLHHTGKVTDNVMTEYEEKFSSMGNPICKLIAGRKSAYTDRDKQIR